MDWHINLHVLRHSLKNGKQTCIISMFINHKIINACRKTWLLPWLSIKGAWIGSEHELEIVN